MKYIATIFFFIVISCGCHSQTNQKNNISKIEKHLSVITKTEKSRNYKNLKTLNFVVDYIKKELDKVCDSVINQNFKVNTTI
jgi:hypothetical protein